jgi:catechol 2,3-dioxygenase-like lactoylglutathione lyase family enzyme
MRMKRLHVHVRVAELPKSVSFYSTMFGTEPTVVKSDYAKWMLEDPRVNFAISSREGAEIGIEHLGIQAEDADELQDVYARLKAADGPVLEEGATTCCYAKSEKSWVSDPDGVLWEAFFTSGSATVYGDAKPLTLASDQAAAGACCTPDMASLGAERPAAKQSSSCGCS